LNSSTGKIKLSLDKPIAGWINMKFACQNYQLDSLISFVPNDPVDEIRIALKMLITNSCNTAQVSFHLEPQWYYFNFEKIDTHNFVLKIFFQN